MDPKITREMLSPAERQALEHLLRQLQKWYEARLTRLILYGRKSRGRDGTDLDLLVVIEGITDRFAEMSRIHKITGPITVDENILMTAIPVDAAFLDSQRETPFFESILREGLALYSTQPSTGE